MNTIAVSKPLLQRQTTTAECAAANGTQGVQLDEEGVPDPTIHDAAADADANADQAAYRLVAFD